MKNISAWSIKKPVPSIVLFIMLLAGGLLSFSTLAIDENPNIDMPQVQVMIEEPGAAPSELEIPVARKVEDAVAGLSGIKHITSTITDGSSTTIIEFQLGTDINQAVNDVRDKISRIRSELPAQISEPIIQKLSFTGNSFVTYLVSCPSMSASELSWLIDNNLSRELLSIPGVGQIQRSGGVDREIRIKLDPAKLEAVGLTAADVSTQVRIRNINMTGGRSNVNATEQAIRAIGSASSIEDLRNLKIAVENGSWVRLDSLGTVEDSHADVRQAALYDNQPVVAFSVIRSTGYGLAQVAEQIDKKLAALKPRLPRGVTIEKVRTNAKFVSESVNATLEAMIIGGLLAVATIWIFLKDWRSAMISAVAMPLSLIPTFWVMKFLNFTLNNMSLLALALVVGILVDDAIVEIENIVRHIQMGKSAREAALEAADEIGLAVIATTMAIIVVFVPVAFMGGISGQFFKQFGITVAVSVFFSLVAARLITPMMAANWLQDKVKEPQLQSETKIVATYDRILKWSLAHRKTTLVAAGLFFATSISLLAFIQTSFITDSDRGETLLTVQLAPGVELAKSKAVAQELTSILLKNPEVEHVFAGIGTATESAGPAHASASAAVNKDTLTVILQPREKRKHRQNEIEQILRSEIAKIPGIKTTFTATQGLGARVQYCLTSSNGKVLDEFVPKLLTEMRQIRGLTDVDTGASLRAPEYTVIPNRNLAAERGVTVQSIASAALISTIGDPEYNLGKYDLPDRQLNIRVTLQDFAKSRLDYLHSLKVPGLNSTLIPLSSVAKLRKSSGPSQIDRYDKQRQITVTAHLVNDMSLGQALKEIRALPCNQHRSSLITESLTGDVELQSEVFSGFASAMFMAVLLMYSVLVLLFDDFIHPLTIMVSLPLAAGGALSGLLIFNQPLGLFSLIGIVMLMGLVAKNAILLVEYCIMSKKNDGLPTHEAIMRSGETRMRPILMTTFAMVIGMVPIASGLGAGAEVRAPMAVAVIGGLITSSVLTLIVVPVIFSLFDELKMQLRKNLHSRMVLSKEESPQHVK